MLTHVPCLQGAPQLLQAILQTAQTTQQSVQNIQQSVQTMQQDVAMLRAHLINMRIRRRNRASFASDDFNAPLMPLQVRASELTASTSGVFY